MGQGFLLAHPAPAVVIETLLAIGTLMPVTTLAAT
jgi:hypothetical protein